MKNHRSFMLAAAAAISVLSFSCAKEPAVNNATDTQDTAIQVQKVALDQLDRDAFNKAAMRLNIPLFWVSEENSASTVTPDRLTTLNFYPTSESFVWKTADGQFTPAFYQAYQKMVDVMKDPLLGATLDENEAARRMKVAQELDQAAATLVASDFSNASESDKKFVEAMLKVGKAIDVLYGKQVGLDIAMSKIPADDIMSQSMARHNWGVKAESPMMKNDKQCRAISDMDEIPVGIYPADLQKDASFCQTLDARPDSSELLSPFTVVVKDGESFKAVPYSEYYKSEMTAVSDALKEAAAAIAGNADEKALQQYLTAAADAFLSNNWEPADEAWAAMNSLNSKWYVRCAPDETYWEPCSRKAGFHLTFARINPDALVWQEKLTPLQQDMEERMAAIAGAPYVSRKVSFHLPDFIDIVTNSGDDRDAFGATVGQSLPNWGPVANEGRGRTIAMNNLYSDPDSLRDRKKLASSLFTAQDLELISDGTVPGLLGTIVHEAAHNLGPAHEYKVNGKVDDEIFGGALATLAEEFKAQTSALWFVSYLVEKSVISQELGNKSYADSIYWCFGQISRGMTTVDGRIQPYSQLAAIQIGMMMEDGALTFDPEAMAANGKDKGAFSIHLDKMAAASERIMSSIAKIKASGDKDALVALQKQHVDNSKVPLDLIRDRMLRLPKTSFVYSVKTK